MVNHMVQQDVLDRMFSALADPTRRAVLTRLGERPATIGELAAPYDMSLTGMTKHVRVLEDAGLVHRRREAQRRPCHLDADVLELMTGWIERRRREAEERYQRLDAVLDRMAAEEGDHREESIEGEAS